jgi:hypothetical protein
MHLTSTVHLYNNYNQINVQFKCHQSRGGGDHLIHHPSDDIIVYIPSYGVNPLLRHLWLRVHFLLHCGQQQVLLLFMYDVTNIII